LIAAPIEIALGAGITALALYARSQPPESDSVSGRLEEAGKDALTRLLFASIGMAGVVGGLGDLTLGALDGLAPSPFATGEGTGRRLLTLEEIAEGPPLRSLQLDAHGRMQATLRGTESQLGIGAFHWLGRRVRLRHSLSLGAGARFENQADGTTLSAAYELRVDLALGRHKLGRYPRSSIFGNWRTGLGVSRNETLFMLGVSKIEGFDRSSAIEFGVGMDFSAN
jgi:hypothetical protein